MNCNKCGYKMDGRFHVDHYYYICGVCGNRVEPLKEAVESPRESFDYAVMKKGRKNAIRVLDEEDTAIEYMKGLKGEGYYIKERKRA